HASGHVGILTLCCQCPYHRFTIPASNTLPKNSERSQRAGPGQPAGVAAAAVRWSAILPVIAS
ncbi:MAG: hypothetical protein ACK6EB_20940, partial [Planctomyces sp.]